MFAVSHRRLLHTQTASFVWAARFFRRLLIWHRVRCVVTRDAVLFAHVLLGFGCVRAVF
jgi:hypothetical protein